MNVVNVVNLDVASDRTESVRRTGTFTMFTMFTGHWLTKYTVAARMRTRLSRMLDAYGRGITLTR